MKIISWNCNMAFRKKAAIILTYKPDIVIIQECENPTKLNFGKDTPQPKQIYWHGTNSNKGIGVFAYSDYSLKLHASHNPDLKNILPIIVENDKIKFLLFAIWANNPLDKDGCYITQVWKALHFYDKLIKKRKQF